MSDTVASSALVVAHPDDETLWFSSILTAVHQVILCFLEVPSRPDWTRGRERFLAARPLANIDCLGLAESEVLNGADWPDPTPTRYGLHVKRSRKSLRGFSDESYRRNFDRLVTELRSRLQGYRDVFTHNPWGEYGHEEHVQVFRAVEALQQELGFTLWFSSYCSNKSYRLMLQYFAKLGRQNATFLTDRDTAARLKGLYREHGCWTWYEGYEWPKEETFSPWHPDTQAGAAEGHVLPINLVKIEWPPLRAPHQAPYRFARRVLRRLRRHAPVVK